MGSRNTGKGHGSKSSVPRHRKQSAAAANRQERAIEKQERQAAASQARAESNQCDGCLTGKPVDARFLAEPGRATNTRRPRSKTTRDGGTARPVMRPNLPLHEM